MKFKDYSNFYKQLTGRIRESGAACFLLRTSGKAATGIMYAAYPALLIKLAAGGESRKLFISVIIPAAGFVLLTAVRAKINRPRPYETWKIEPLIHKDTRGCSMPSRHVFSSAVIAMSWMPVSLPAGLFLLAVSAAAALIRVLGGVHYPSDVIAGYLAGIAAGIPLLLLH
jgi:membrane-associated phospholipid phosphatase